MKVAYTRTRLVELPRQTRSCSFSPSRTAAVNVHTASVKCSRKRKIWLQLYSEYNTENIKRSKGTARFSSPSLALQAQGCLSSEQHLTMSLPHMHIHIHTHTYTHTHAHTYTHSTAAPQVSWHATPVNTVDRRPTVSLDDIRVRPAAQQVDRSVSLSVGQSVGRSIDRSVGRSVSRSVGRLVSQSVGRSVCRSVSQSGGRSVGQSVSQSVGRSIGRSVSLSIGQSVCR